MRKVVTFRAVAACFVIRDYILLRSNTFANAPNCFTSSDTLLVQRPHLRILGRRSEL